MNAIFQMFRPITHFNYFLLLWMFLCFGIFLFKCFWNQGKLSVCKNTKAKNDQSTKTQKRTKIVVVCNGPEGDLK